MSKYLMGTMVEATIVHPNMDVAQAGLLAAFQEMERVEALLGRDREGSDIDRVNDAPTGEPVFVSEETYLILERARGYGERLDGLFDITSLPAVNLWGLGEVEITRAPDSADVLAVQRLIDYRQIALDPVARTVSLSKPGMSVDLGGIAKGYAVDRGAAVLASHGITDFLINAGGDLFASGVREANQPWRVGIQHPRDPSGLIVRLEMTDGAVATSGDYERFVELDGVRYPHIIDPRTARPATARQSASAVAATAEEADVLATYLFISGSLDIPGAAMIVAADGTVKINGAGQDLFEVIR
ncbi:MAG: thiamine biosynthesis lipoprotein [Rhodothermales bacterium]